MARNTHFRRRSRKPFVVPEPDDARYTGTMERLFYEPHYATRGLVVHHLAPAEPSRWVWEERAAAEAKEAECLTTT